MGRNWILGLAGGLAMATSAMALDLDAMSPAEEAAFGEAVRAYLLANPEVLREALEVLEEREQMAQAAADDALVAAHEAALFDDGHSYVGGNPEGDVTVVEFLDYRCGYCKRAHPEVAELVETDGNIRTVIKEFPILGEESVLASRFAISVLQTEGAEAYAHVNDALMAHRGAFTEDAFRRIAEEQLLDAEAILAAMDAESVTEVIQKNHALAQSMAIGGTPTFVFGGQMVRGYVPLDAMREVVKEQRADG